jgi:hypothetical protein
MRSSGIGRDVMNGLLIMVGALALFLVLVDEVVKAGNHIRGGYRSWI